MPYLSRQSHRCLPGLSANGKRGGGEKMNFRRLTRNTVAGMCAWLFAVNVLVANAAPKSLPSARDLVADAKISTTNHQPIVVLVSLPGCPHCELVRRSYLLPLLNESASIDAPIIRQIELKGENKMIDFAGKKITHAEFSRRFQVRLAPVVFFFGPNGTQLAEPLVGSMIPDFYGAYFDAALLKARAQLTQTHAKASP